MTEVWQMKEKKISRGKIENLFSRRQFSSTFKTPQLCGMNVDILPWMGETKVFETIKKLILKVKKKRGKEEIKLYKIQTLHSNISVND